MQIVDIAVSELRPFDGNVRKHSEKQVKEMMRALKQFGQTRAIVCDEEGMVLVGNCLLEAVKRLEWETVQCYRIEGLSAAKKKKLVLSDNQIYKLGGDDFDAIRALVADISMEDDLDIAGYDMDVLEAMSLDVDDLEEELQDYGTVTDPKYTTYTPAEPPQNAQRPQHEEPEQVSDGKTEKPYSAPEPTKTSQTVVCPNCGEVIYLD